jgi:nitroreductase
MVDNELIEKVIKAGMYAPSGKNKQSPIILAITNRKIRDELSRLCRDLRGMDSSFDPFYNAPVVLVVLASKDMFTAVYDGSVVIENMLLEAHSLGLGACWIHWCKEMFETDYGKNLLKGLGVEGEYEGIGSCILGYPNIAIGEPLPRKDKYVYYIR